MEKTISATTTMKELYLLLVEHFDREGFPSGFVAVSWEEYLHAHITKLDAISVSLLEQAINHWNSLPEETI